MRKITPSSITQLEPNQIFVFGSNLAGRHGRGAAYVACKKFGADYGVGFGRTGNCFAIPTKGANLRRLALSTIHHYVNHFIFYAHDCPNLEFLVTPIGCGLSRYEPKEIALMFKDAPSNVWLPQSFVNVLK